MPLPIGQTSHNNRPPSPGIVMLPRMSRTQDKGRFPRGPWLLTCTTQGRERAFRPPLPLGLCPWAYRVQMGALVLGAVAGVAEGLLAAWVLAQVRLLTRVAPQVDLEVLQPREGLAAAFKLQERLVRGALQPRGEGRYSAWERPQHPLPPRPAQGLQVPHFSSPCSDRDPGSIRKTLVGSCALEMAVRAREERGLSLSGSGRIPSGRWK